MQLDLPVLSHILSAQCPDIAFVYLFGSSKEGTVKEGADVDIAVYYTGEDLFIRLQIVEALEKEFPGLVFDIVELQKVNPILAFEAISGKLLFVRDESMEKYIDFYTRICHLYEDRMYWMRKQLEYRGYEVQWDY